MSDPTSLRAAREKLVEAIDNYGEACAAIDHLSSDEYWDGRQAARDVLDMALAAALSGEPPPSTGQIQRDAVTRWYQEYADPTRPDEEDRAALLRLFPGEPPAPTPEPRTIALDFIVAAKEKAFQEQEFEVAHILREAELWLAPERRSKSFSPPPVGVPPAAPTAATRPEDDAGIADAVDDLLNLRTANLSTRMADLYAAISDWHRRTMGGEP